MCQWISLITSSKIPNTNQVFLFATYVVGTLDNLLQRVEEIKEGRIKEVHNYNFIFFLDFVIGNIGSAKVIQSAVSFFLYICKGCTSALS